MTSACEKLTSLQLTEMQICQLFVAFRTDALVCSRKKICLNLLKGSQNSFSGLQPESSDRHGVRFQHVEVGDRKKELGFPFPLSSLSLSPGQSGWMTGAGDLGLALGFAPPLPAGMDRRPTGFPAPAFPELCPFGRRMAAVTTHTQTLSSFPLSTGGPLQQGQLRGLVLPVDV